MTDSAPRTHHTAMLNGVRLHWVEQGSGPLVVLLHGFPDNWWSWRHQLDALAAAGYRAAALDMRGYNESEARGPYDIDTLAADVLALMTHLGETSASLIGHDWGGGLAWYFAAVHPRACRALVVINAPHPAPFQRQLRTNPRQIWRSWYMFFFLLPWLPEWFCRRRDAAWLRSMYETSEPTHFSAAELAPITQMWGRPGALRGPIAYSRAAVWRGLLHASSYQRLARIEAPTLLIWGRRDRWLDYDGLVPGTQRLVSSLRIETLPHAHHYPHWECVEPVNRWVFEALAQARQPS